MISLVNEDEDETLLDSIRNIDDLASLLRCSRPGDYDGLPLPTKATSALPGSPEKIAVMLERARRGEAVFHPLDLDIAAARALKITVCPNGHVPAANRLTWGKKDDDE